MNRILTAAIGVPITILLTIYAPGWLFTALIAVIFAACFDELLTLASKVIGSKPGRWILLLGIAVTASFAEGAPAVLTTTTLAGLVLITVTTFSVSIQEALPKAAIGIFGIVYCSFLPGFLLLMTREGILVLLGILWIGDTAALYCGRSMGRHPLAPSISPRKTVEGAFAGLIGSVIAGVVLGVILAGEPPAKLVAASLVAACAGQVGDLAESALKRSAGVKDSSSLLPGHGGLLDRLDGLLFAAPAYYWFFH